MIHELSWEYAMQKVPINLDSPEKIGMDLGKYYQEAISFLKWLTGGNVFSVFCYIRKNNQKLIKKLEEIGYSCGLYSKDDPNLAVCKDYYYSVPDKEIPGGELFIDCGESEDLFLGLAAYREDSNAYQWFIDEGTWIYYMDNDHISVYSRKPRKATPQELIEHFKKG